MEGKGLRVNVDKAKSMHLLFARLFRKKSSVLKVDPCGVSGGRVGCDSSVENVRVGFIIVVLMCLGR